MDMATVSTFPLWQKILPYLLIWLWGGSPGGIKKFEPLALLTVPSGAVFLDKTKHLSESVLENLGNPGMQQVYDQYKSVLDPFKLKMAGVALKEPVHGVFYQSPFDWEEAKDVSVLDQANPFAGFAVRIPLDSQKAFQEFMTTKLNWQLYTGQDPRLEGRKIWVAPTQPQKAPKKYNPNKNQQTAGPDVWLEFGPEGKGAFLVFQRNFGVKPSFINKAIGGLMTKIQLPDDSDQQPSTPFVEIRYDFERLENQLKNKDFGKFLAEMEKKHSPQTGAANRDQLFWVSYVLELYYKFNSQTYKMTPRPLGGRVFSHFNKDKNWNIRLSVYGDQINREFLKEYTARRQKSLTVWSVEGQVDPGFDNPPVHISIPMGLKDLLTSLENYKGDDLYLIQDIFHFLVSISDVLLLENTRQGLWKQVNGSLDMFVIEAPNMQKMKDPYQYRFAIVGDLKNPATFTKVVDKLRRRWELTLPPKGHEPKDKNDNILPRKDFQKLGVTEWVFVSADKKKKIYLFHRQGAVFLTNDESLYSKRDKLQRKSGFMRHQISGFLPGATPGQSWKEGDEIPFFFRVDMDALRENLSRDLPPIMKMQVQYLPKIRNMEFGAQFRESGRQDYEVNIRFK